MKRLRRWLRLRRPNLGGLVRAAAKLTLVGAIFLALTSPAVAFYQTPGIDGIASKLAGRKVTVHCQTKAESLADPVTGGWGASGYVEGINDPFTGRWFPNDYAVFAYGICEDLTRIAKGDLSGRLFDDAVWAVIVLTHESGHLRGAPWSGNESKTQCWALQHLKSTLNQLGVKDPEAVAFYRAWALEIQKQMPFEYQFLSCRGVTP